MPRLPSRSDATSVVEPSAIEATDAGAQAMAPGSDGGAVQSDGAQTAATDVPTLPAVAPSAPATPHQWDDQYVGMGGSYVVIDGKRVPADSV